LPSLRLLRSLPRSRRRLSASAKQALATTTQIANTLVFDIGQNPRVSGLPVDLLRQMFDRAIQGYDQAIRLDPKNAAAYNGRGGAYQAKGDDDHAIADYDQEIRLDPKYAGAFYNRGSAYGAKGDLDHAIADYDQAIRLDPKYAGAFYNRGSAYGAKGDLDHAIADLDQAICLDPKNADGY
jgi:tetratricopeptide (TPR) repeat protein